MDPHGLAFSEEKDEDVKVFFLKYSLYKMAGKSIQVKVLALVRFLEDEALHFYLEMFTEGDELQEERTDYSNVRSVILSRYSKQKTEAETIYEAVDIR